MKFKNKIQVFPAFALHNNESRAQAIFSSSLAFSYVSRSGMARLFVIVKSSQRVTFGSDFGSS